MSPDKSFSHISIADDDDDIVIEAGLRTAGAAELYEPFDEVAEEFADSFDEADDYEEESIEEPMPEVVEDEYPEQTLEDLSNLEDVPLGKARIAILVLAAIAVAAIVVYSTFFLGK